MKTVTRVLFVCPSLAAVLLGTAPAQQVPKEEPAVRIGDHYTLATCPISGKKLGAMGVPVVKLYAGREIRFCCGSCTGRFEKEIAANMAKVDAAVVADQLPLYPLTTSVVSGDKLPAKPIDVVHGNRLVRLAAEKERAALDKEPAKYIALLDKAVVAVQGKDYVLERCPVSDEEYGSEADRVDLVLGGRLVRLSCGGCVEAVHRAPLEFVQIVDAALAKRAKDKEPPPRERGPGRQSRA